MHNVFEMVFSSRHTQVILEIKVVFFSPNGVNVFLAIKNDSFTGNLSSSDHL